MSGDDIGYAIYLGAMLIFVGGYVMVAGRGRVPLMLKQAASWALGLSGRHRGIWHLGAMAGRANIQTRAAKNGPA